MHQTDLSPWQHKHNFNTANRKGEQKTLIVMVITAVTMVAEITAGSLFGSMALLTDGWHMGTHFTAFLITIFAYRFSRKHAENPAYSFGTGKVNSLGGFASAVALALVALMMAVESVERLLDPREIQFNQAILVAGTGLLINVISAIILKDNHQHGDHEHHHHHDQNLKAAYLHVLADALTSVTAIAALLAGKFLGWNWLDPVVGIVGAAVIIRWSYGLVKETAPVLLDSGSNAELQQEITNKLESLDDVKIADLHLWQVSPGQFACTVSVVTHTPQTAAYYKSRIDDIDKIVHLIVEVNLCPENR